MVKSEEPVILRSRSGHSPLGRIRVAVRSPREMAMPDWPWRRYDAYALVMITDGLGRYRDPRGRDRIVQPGDVILVRPEEPHWYGPDGDSWGEVFVIFEGPIFDLVFERGVPGADDPVRRLLPLAPWIARLERVLRPSLPDPASPERELCEFVTLLVRILGSGVDGESVDGDPILSATRMLAGDLKAELPLSSIATHCGLSYETFRRRFAREVGVTAGRYRDDCRIEAATELLRNTRLPHRVIAASLGFVDEYHFSKRYRAIAGVSPREARSQPLRSSEL